MFMPRSRPKSRLEGIRGCADDGSRKSARDSPDRCGIMWRASRRGLAVRRLQLRRERGPGHGRVRAHRPCLPPALRRHASAFGRTSSTGSMRTIWRTRPRAGRPSTTTRTPPLLQQTPPDDGLAAANICIDYRHTRATRARHSSRLATASRCRWKVAVRSPVSTFPAWFTGTGFTVRGTSTMRIENLSDLTDRSYASADDPHGTSGHAR